MIWPFRARVPPPTAPERDWWVEVAVSLEGLGYRIEDAEREVEGYLFHVGIRCTEDAIATILERAVTEGEIREIDYDAVDINTLHRSIRRATPADVPTVWYESGRIYY